MEIAIQQVGAFTALTGRKRGAAGKVP